MYADPPQDRLTVSAVFEDLKFTDNRLFNEDPGARIRLGQTFVYPGSHFQPTRSPRAPGPNPSQLVGQDIDRARARVGETVRSPANWGTGTRARAHVGQTCLFPSYLGKRPSRPRPRGRTCTRIYTHRVARFPNRTDSRVMRWKRIGCFGSFSAETTHEAAAWWAGSMLRASWRIASARP